MRNCGPFTCVRSPAIDRPATTGGGGFAAATDAANDPVAGRIRGFGPGARSPFGTGRVGRARRAYASFARAA